MAKKQKEYTATDGKLFLLLKPAKKGRFSVTSPFIPGMVSEAKTLEEAFAMARDTVATLKANGRKLAKTRSSSEPQEQPIKRKAAKQAKRGSKRSSAIR